MTKTSLTRPLCTLCSVLPHTIRTSLYHIPLALLAFLSPLSSLPVFFRTHSRLLRMQRFSLCFFSHHQNFPLRCSSRHYFGRVLLQSLLFLVTPLYGSSSAPAPVPPCRAPFLRFRDTQLALHTLLPYVYKQRTPILLLDTCLILTSKLSSQLHDVPASQEFGILWTLPNCSTTPLQTPLLPVLVPAAAPQPTLLLLL